MKTKDLIKQLQEADPSGEEVVCVGNTPIYYVDSLPGYYDGCARDLIQDPELIGKSYSIIGGRIISTGMKISIKTYDIDDMLYDNPEAPVEFDGPYAQRHYESSVEKWRELGRSGLRHTLRWVETNGLPSRSSDIPKPPPIDLTAIRSNWHLLIDEGITKVQEGRDVKMLWGAGYYDGPGCGVCLYKDKHYWFERISGGTHMVKYHDLEIGNNIYAIAEMSDAEYKVELRRQERFRVFYGDRCDYTYTTTESYGDVDYQKRRGTGNDKGSEDFEKYKIEVKEIPRVDFSGNKVVAWWHSE